MRIVTRPDFDGIVCATLLLEAEYIDQPTLWIEPSDIQKGFADIKKNDIVSNLPHHPNATMWFDHHFSNKNVTEYIGLFQIAPSAAGLIYTFYKHLDFSNYLELIRETDRIDSANLTKDEVNFPEKYPYVLLSMTVTGRDKTDEPYWNFLAEYLRNHSIEQALEHPDIKLRCDKVIEDNIIYKDLLKSHTRIENGIAITDFRNFEKSPQGNRFLVYSMFPEAHVQVKITNDNNKINKTIIAVGQSIFNINCNVNVGLMLTKTEGGGHRGAGACNFASENFESYFAYIFKTLSDNIANDEQ